MLMDREVVDVDQQLLDKTGNSLGIEYNVCNKIFMNNNFCKFCKWDTFFLNIGRQIFWLHKSLYMYRIRMPYKHGRVYKR